MIDTLSDIHNWARHNLILEHIGEDTVHSLDMSFPPKSQKKNANLIRKIRINIELNNK